MEHSDAYPLHIKQIADALDRLILNFMPYKKLEGRTSIAKNLFNAVCDYPADLVESAVDYIIAHDEFLPTGKRLVDAVKKVNKVAETSYGVFAAESLKLTAQAGLSTADDWHSLAERAKAAGMVEIAAAFQSRADYLADLAAAFGAGNGDAFQQAQAERYKEPAGVGVE